MNDVSDETSSVPKPVQMHPKVSFDCTLCHTLQQIQKGEQVMQPLLKVFEKALPTQVKDSRPKDPTTAPKDLMTPFRHVTPSLTVWEDEDNDQGPRMTDGHVSPLLSKDSLSEVLALTEGDGVDVDCEEERSKTDMAHVLNAQAVIEQEATQNLEASRSEEYDEMEEEDSDDVTTVQHTTPFKPRQQSFRINASYHILKLNRLHTKLGLWPLKEAEARVKESTEEMAVKSRILDRYKGRVARGFRPPVTRVPWGLIDELQAESIKWQTEKASYDRHVYRRMIQNRTNNNSKSSRNSSL